jgi:hypothetical protein
MGFFDDLKDNIGSIGGLAGGYLLGGPIGAYVGASVGSSVDSSRLTKGINKEQLKQNRYFFDQNADHKIRRLAADARRAGLSPLAALGAAPAALPNINLSTPRGTGDVMTGLAEALIQMELMDKQIQIMEKQHQASLVNSNTDELLTSLTAEPVQRRPNHSEGMPGAGVTSGGELYAIPAGTPQERLEQEIGEWSDWMPDTLHRSYKVFKEQLRAKTMGTTEFNKLLHQFRLWAAKNNLMELMHPKYREQYRILAMRSRYAPKWDNIKDPRRHKYLPEPPKRIFKQPLEM